MCGVRSRLPSGMQVRHRILLTTEISHGSVITEMMKHLQLYHLKVIMVLGRIEADDSWKQ